MQVLAEQKIQYFLESALCIWAHFILHWQLKGSCCDIADYREARSLICATVSDPKRVF